MGITESGRLEVWNGQIVAENGPAPVGNEEILVSCAGETKAKLITWEDNGIDKVCLWLKGELMVATYPMTPGDPCWYSVYNSAGTLVAQIDDEGNMRLVGLAYASDGIEPSLGNLQLSPGGGTLYD